MQELQQRHARSTPACVWCGLQQGERGKAEADAFKLSTLCCRELWGKIAALPAAAKRSISKLESVLFRVCAQCAATVALFDPSSHSRCHMSPVVAHFIFLILSHFHQGEVLSCFG